MKKDNIRDYAAEAFRFYAQYARTDNVDEVICDDPAARADIEAVDRVIEGLNGQPGGDLALKCLELVYFTQPRKRAARGAISDRARYAARQLGMSESGVYRTLKKLRIQLATERGLRIDPVEHRQ